MGNLKKKKKQIDREQTGSSHGVDGWAKWVKEIKRYKLPFNKSVMRMKVQHREYSQYCSISVY